MDKLEKNSIYKMNNLMQKDITKIKKLLKNNGKQKDFIAEVSSIQAILIDLANLLDVSLVDTKAVKHISRLEEDLKAFKTKLKEAEENMIRTNEEEYKTAVLLLNKANKTIKILRNKPVDTKPFDKLAALNASQQGMIKVLKMDKASLLNLLNSFKVNQRNMQKKLNTLRNIKAPVQNIKQTKATLRKIRGNIKLINP